MVGLNEGKQGDHPRTVAEEENLLVFHDLGRSAEGPEQVGESLAGLEHREDFLQAVGAVDDHVDNAVVGIGVDYGEWDSFPLLLEFDDHEMPRKALHSHFRIIDPHPGGALGIRGYAYYFIHDLSVWRGKRL